MNSLERLLFFSTAGPEVVHDDQIVHWNMNDALLHEMDYKDGRLVVKKEGYYYVYSMVSFSYSKSFFRHSVLRTAPDFEVYYSIISTVTHPQGLENQGYSDSYLSGVFHFCKGCNIFVKVSDTSNVLRGRSETFFGAFMI